MPRYKIMLPEKFIFSTKIHVQIYHINYGNHLGHDSLISILHEARIQFLRQFNYQETDIEGLGFVVSQLISDYKGEAFYGELLRIDLSIIKENKKSCNIYYLVTNDVSGQVIAHAQTTITFFDFNKRKSASIPKAFEEKVLT